MAATWGPLCSGSSQLCFHPGDSLPDWPTPFVPTAPSWRLPTPPVGMDCGSESEYTYFTFGSQMVPKFSDVRRRVSGVEVCARFSCTCGQLEARLSAFK